MANRSCGSPVGASNYLQHELNVIARTKWVDYEVTIPFRSQISKDFLDNLLSQFLELYHVVCVAEAFVTF